MRSKIFFCLLALIITSGCTQLNSDPTTEPPKPPAPGDIGSADLVGEAVSYPGYAEPRNFDVEPPMLYVDNNGASLEIEVSALAIYKEVYVSIDGKPYEKYFLSGTPLGNSDSWLTGDASVSVFIPEDKFSEGSSEDNFVISYTCTGFSSIEGWICNDNKWMIQQFSYFKEKTCDENQCLVLDECVDDGESIGEFICFEGELVPLPEDPPEVDDEIDDNGDDNRMSDQLLSLDLLVQGNEIVLDVPLNKDVVFTSEVNEIFRASSAKKAYLGGVKDELDNIYYDNALEAFIINRRYPNIVLDDIRQRQGDRGAASGIYFKTNHNIKAWVGSLTGQIHVNPEGTLRRIIIGINHEEEPKEFNYQWKHDDVIVEEVNGHANLGINKIPSSSLDVNNEGDDKSFLVSKNNVDYLVLDSSGELRLPKISGSGGSLCVDSEGYLFVSTDLPCI